MTLPNLKIFHPDPSFNMEGEGHQSKTASEMILEGVYDPVRIAASDFIRLIHNAVTHQRAWLHDFEEDAMVISKDLYEVLLAYQRMVEKRAA